MGDDGIIVMIIIIVTLGKKDDFVRLEDKSISSANVFVEFTDGEFDILEEFSREQFHGGGNHEAVFF